MTLDERERMVLETLQRLPKLNIVLIGGYALNAYVPPRFSIDCDLVVLGNPSRVESLLKKSGFEKSESGETSYGTYVRYEKLPGKISFDLMIGSLVDRDTKIVFEGALFKKYSRRRSTIGRTVPVRIQMRIADPELLFAMKFVSARRQDVRDLFMLAGENLKLNVVREIVSEKCSPELRRKRAELIKSSVESSGYRDSLQGPFGKIPDKRFELCRKSIVELVESLNV